MCGDLPISTSRRYAIRLRRYAHIETYVLHLPCQLSTSSRRAQGREPRGIGRVCLRGDTHRGELSVAAKAGRLELVQVGYLIQGQGVVVGHWEEEPETAAHQLSSIVSASAAVHHTIPPQSIHLQAEDTQIESDKERTSEPDEATRPPSTHTPRNP
jgi:hypothetical protein